MTSKEIRQRFLKFYEDRGHAIIPSAPIVPQHDPTVLFTVAGVHPLVPYILGQPHPAGKRLANVQKCIRTVDIEEVGDDSHSTFMEMLGHWSLGDYFKAETIPWSREFFTQELGLDPKRLAVTVFVGDKDAPRDEESAKVWQAQGVPKDRIFYYGKDDNWWGPAGQTGPCGPSTEIFYWTDDKEAPKSEPANDDRWLELGNNVLMEYEKTADGKFKPLAQKNVDTGLGFERIVGVMQGASNVYETDLMLPILEKIQELSQGSDQRAERIIADHLKAAAFIIADGVRPSNVDQGYVLRRLIRRAIRQGRHLHIEYPFTETIADAAVHIYQDAYPELQREQQTIKQVLLDEEAKFAKTISRGLKELSGIKKPTGRELFHVFETYGIPLEVSAEELKIKQMDKLQKEFDQAFKKHQAQSRAGAEQKFAGGLADHSEKVIQMHTATHLLNAALRDVLGEHVHQRGSNITQDRLRFDFSHPEKLTEEQINQIEALVNEKIKEDLSVEHREMPREEAERIGAEREFGHKYPDIVSVYVIGDFSKEYCGGPHVEYTGQIGTFKITKQESVGAGVRRLKAVVES